jgi:hypothetical protein
MNYMHSSAQTCKPSRRPGVSGGPRPAGAIGRLAALEELHLAGNRLTELPEAIGRLEKLFALDLSDNPMAFPRREQLRGMNEIRAYLRAAYEVSDAAPAADEPSAGG